MGVITAHYGKYIRHMVAVDTGGTGERVRKEEKEEREGREREKREREGGRREREGREYIYYYSLHKLVMLTYSNTDGELMFGRTEVLLSVYI